MVTLVNTHGTLSKENVTIIILCGNLASTRVGLGDY